MTDRTLEGQLAVVTGASTGIGLAVAGGLARRGATVVGLARGRDRLVAAMEQLATATGATTTALAADVTDTASVTSAVEEVLREHGGIDLVVNAAGLVDAAEVPVWRAEPEQWWAVVESHVRGALLVVQAVVPHMVTRGRGRLVNLASGMGTRAVADYSAYSVAKSGQMRLTEALDESLQGTGVRAFNLAPGLVQTEMTRSMPKWRDHTAWTPPERVVELVAAAAEGRLDAWSGRFLRAGVDLPDEVADMVPAGDARLLRLRPYGPGDPVA